MARAPAGVRARAAERAPRLLLLLLSCALLAPRSAGQGLLVNTKASSMGASGSTGLLSSVYSQSRAWKAAFRSNPRGACSRAGRSLCASGADPGSDVYPRLVVATSPLAYSSASPASTGGFDFVPAARDQRPCAACTAFAVAAAAQAAVAAALRVNASAVGPLSTLDLMYCGAGAPTACSAGQTLTDVLEQLKQRRIAPEACMPYRPPPLDATNPRPPPECAAAGCAAGAGADDGDAVAAPVERHHELAAQGTFSYQSVFDEWAIASHIRQYGAVVSRFDLMDDFKAFFSDPANRRRVYRPKPGARLLETHAVAIVGYNITEGSWLCLNSWGPGFADNGMFRVAFGECSIASAPDTYGIIWKPSFAAGRKLSDTRSGALTPAPGAPGCFYYTAQRGDYLSGIALRFSVQLPRLLLDNVDAIADLDAPIAGKRLLLCGMQSELDKTVASFKQALKKNAVGISLNCFSYPSYYVLGVLDVLQQLGVYTAATKTSSIGPINGCLLCAGWGVGAGIKLYDELRANCSRSSARLCMRSLKAASLAAMEATLPMRGVAAKCSQVCYTGISAIDPSIPHHRGSYYEVSDYASDADFLQAQLAAGYFPVASDGRESAPYRRAQSISGFSALGGRQPPCPPGVEFCLRVTCAPPPDFMPSQMTIEVAIRSVVKAMRRSPDFTHFADIILPPANASAPPPPPGSPARVAAAEAAAAAALAYQPAAAELKRSGAQAVDMGVDIAPGLYSPLPLDQQPAMDMVMLPPDDDVAAWMAAMGRKDARLWAKLWGLA